MRPRSCGPMPDPGWTRPSGGYSPKCRCMRSLPCTAKPGCANGSRSRSPTSLRRIRTGSGMRWRWHCGCTQVTGGSANPMSTTCSGVTIRILSHYRARDPDVACAALLHDAVEDHADGIAPGRQAALAVLAGRFGARTAALVGAVTNPVWARPRRA
jgi:(p)ppGpp synthase/HD superfamily hydrolase